MVDVIENLRSAGVSIIYSNELIPDRLRVQTEPEEADPLERLRSILREYGLALRAGPQDSYLVVRDETVAPADATRPAPAAAPPVVFGPPTLEDIVVSASRYAFARDTATSTRMLSRAQIEQNPTLGDDALRATHSLPGLTSSGLTAKANVRGGTSDEASLFIDGVRLLNPFHLKDFESVFSSVSPRLIDSMTVYTGAFPAEFGDRMSAVVDMRTIAPSARRLYELELNTLTSSALSSGLFASGRGAWTTSVRRGNLDLLIDAANSDLGRPQYLDFFNNVSYELNDKWALSIGALVLDDKITLRESDTASASADYDDNYLWSRFDYVSDRFAASYLLSGIALDSQRAGEISDPQRSTGRLSDVRSFNSRSVKADWSYDFNDDHRMRWGIEFMDSDSSYRYSATRVDHVPIVIAGLEAPPSNLTEEIAPEGSHTAAYLSYRAQPAPRVVTELGLRWDEQDYIPDRQLSPRLNVLFDIGERTSLRASWGRYHQSQRLDEIQITGGETSPGPAQKSEHSVLGFEYLPGDRVAIRIEAYRKEFDKLRPRYENLFSKVSLLPELLPDRVVLRPLSGEARGVEFSAESELDHWSWRVNLTRSDTHDELVGGSAPRSWQERWSVKGGMTWQGNRWTVGANVTWHSGWPISPLSLSGTDLVAGAYNSARFGQFESLDVRATRQIELERGTLEWFIELNNALDSNNPCCLDYGVDFGMDGAPAELHLGTNNWLAIIPTIGIRWQSTR